GQLRVREQRSILLRADAVPHIAAELFGKLGRRRCRDDLGVRVQAQQIRRESPARHRALAVLWRTQQHQPAHFLADYAIQLVTDRSVNLPGHPALSRVLSELEEIPPRLASAQ